MEKQKAPAWRAIEMMEFPVAAAAGAQKFGAQTQFDGKKIVGLMWVSALELGPGGTAVIGTTNARAKTECFITLKRGQQDIFNTIPVLMLDPDNRAGETFWLPEPMVLDWNNSSVRFITPAYLTAGEVLVLYAFIQ